MAAAVTAAQAAAAAAVAAAVAAAATAAAAAPAAAGPLSPRHACQKAKFVVEQRPEGEYFPPQQQLH